MASVVINLTPTVDFLYIGSDLPFNHRYFQVSVANAVSSVLSAEIWNGSEWKAAVDVIDQTSVGGKTFAQSGIISWSVNRYETWGQQASTEDIPALSTLRIYDFFWARLKVSVSLTSTTALSYIGHKFSNDTDLGIYYPDLVQTDVKDAFSTGKTGWDEQHIFAAEEIISDIRQKNLAWSGNQIMNAEAFNLASVHKVAANIMLSFGDDYVTKRKTALEEYGKAMNLKIFEIDRNIDGRLDASERFTAPSGLAR